MWFGLANGSGSNHVAQCFQCIKQQDCQDKHTVSELDQVVGDVISHQVAKGALLGASFIRASRCCSRLPGGHQLMGNSFSSHLFISFAS